MAKYCDKIGFVETVEVRPGEFEYSVIEKKRKGDVLRNTRRWEGRDTLLDNVNISNTLSIVANDSYFMEHYSAIRYAWWHGVCWEVTNIEILRPRLNLTLGGVYNGPTAESEGATGSGGEDRERILPAP